MSPQTQGYTGSLVPGIILSWYRKGFLILSLVPYRMEFILSVHMYRISLEEKKRAILKQSLPKSILFFVFTKKKEKKKTVYKEC